MLPEVLNQEQKVSEAFSKQSPVFDEADAKNEILQWMRAKVRAHALSLWKPREHILELNAGTGLDAIYFAQKGFYVYATDNAPGMLQIIEKKIKELQLEDNITTQQCSFLQLDKLDRKKFNHIFSNFGGVNCTDKLEDVIKSFDKLLKPGGTVTLVIMPPTCLWEILFAFKGNFKLAFRRLQKNGTPSHLEGLNFTAWYYSPTRVAEMFGKEYSILSTTGLGITVPPPFMEDFPVKHPKAFERLKSMENSIAKKAPFNSWGDHFIISAKKLS